MAGPTNAAPASFSYAQAARGTSKPAPPQSNKSANTETIKNGTEEPVTSQQIAVDASESSKPEIKSSIVERAKSEDKTLTQSGIPSPDTAASATSHDEFGQNGSSQTSWEAKSQVSEPAVASAGEGAWIKERQERQSNQQTNTQSENSAPTAPAAKAPELHEAPPPSVNPWQKRAEVAKAKPITNGTPPVKPAAESQKENHRPVPAKAQKSAPSVLEMTSAAKNGRPENARGARHSEQLSKPPVVNDSNWPTPDTSKPVEKTPTEEHTDDKGEDGTGKPRKKQEWSKMQVTPNILYNTPGLRDRAIRGPPNGERAPRGGAGVRGRGGYRGASNTAAASANHGERNEDTTARGRTSNEAVSSIPVRASSGGSRKDDGQNNHQRKPTGGQPARTVSNNQPKSAELAESAKETAPLANDTSTEHATEAARDTPVEAVNHFSNPSHTPTSGPEHRRDTRETSWSGPPRGNRRGRGRGGNREVVNGHPYPFTNGHAPEFAMSPQFGAPTSPIYSPRGGHQAFSNSYRGGSRTPSNRTQTFPMDPFYGRMQNPYMGNMPLAPLQTYQPFMPDVNGFPASAIGFPGQADPQMYLLGTVGQQLDFYFSENNLLGDMFLRKNMDSQGFVFLDVIAEFKKLANLTTDRELLKAACLSSETIEIKVGDDGKERLRRAYGWDQYVLPMDQRFPAAMNDGPQHVENISQQPLFPVFPHPQMVSQSNPTTPYMGGSPAMNRDPRSAEHSFMPMSVMTPQAMFIPEFAPPNGDMNGEASHRLAHSPHHESNHDTGASVKSESTSTDPDTFPDEQIEQLTVCVKMSKERLPYHNSAARTFSNGSIDTSVVNGEKEDTEVKSSKPADVQSSEKEKSEAEPSSAEDLSVFWIKDNDNPVGLLPSDLTPEPYLQLRHKALDQRQRATSGTCPYDLDVLYQFWSHFLIRNYNNSMYAEFKHLAGDDANQRQSDSGHQNLIKYYDQALNSSNQIPLRVAKDYVALVNEQSKQKGPAFKNLLRSWRDGALNLHNRKRISDLMDADLRQILGA